MKKNYFLYSSLIVISFIMYGFGNGDGLRYPSGAPAGYTGSPFDGKNCSQCHGGSLSNVDSIITSNIPAEGYVAGDVYTITITSSGSGEKGFEVSPQNFSGDLLGTIITGSGTKLVGNNKYLTHTNTVNSNPAVWTFQWLAPAEGTGNVVFYGSFAVTHHHTNLSTMLVSEDVTTSINKTGVTIVSVYPNPISDYANLKYYLNNAQHITANLYSLDGKLVYTYLDKVQGGGTHNMKLSSEPVISKGIYILNITVGKYNTVKKLLFR